jgi:hypothetical protein
MMRWLSVLTLAPPLLSAACNLDADVMLGSDFGGADGSRGREAAPEPSSSTGSGGEPCELGSGGSAPDTCDAGPDVTSDASPVPPLVIRGK